MVKDGLGSVSEQYSQLWRLLSYDPGGPGVRYTKTDSMPASLKKVRTTDFARWKQQRRKISMLTAYDATMAALLDRAGVDALLVGDSLGMVVMGHETTIPVTLHAVIHHAAAVS